MLTQKGVPFSWGITLVIGFQTLKDKMTTGPVLILPDLQKLFEVYCDACGRSLGAVLMQEGRVIAYESRMFSEPEMTAQIYEKELLVVIHALTQWRHYLLGADFTVFTDHQSSRYFLSQKQLSEKQMRWANILSQFHFQIVHVQGQKNVVADALFRKPLVQAISAIHHSTFKDMVDQYATDTDFAEYFHSDTRWGDSSGIFHTGRLLDAKDYVVRHTIVAGKGYDQMPLSTGLKNLGRNYCLMLKMQFASSLGEVEMNCIFEWKLKQLDCRLIPRWCTMRVGAHATLLRDAMLHDAGWCPCRVGARCRVRARCRVGVRRGLLP
ncbi:hypothetical protein L7F22_060867 [Adiantum nelumboides]|nr:hypothetical protein [Adiantum nelumboides]